MEGEKKGCRSDFVTKLAKIIVMIVFIIKCFPNCCKIFARECFLTDNLKVNIVNKTTYKKTLSKLSLTMCTFVKELSNCYESFLRLSEFSDFTHKMKFSIRKNFHNNKETIKNNNKE